MKLKDLLAISFKTLKSNIRWSILTVLGLVLGIAALTVTLMMIEGINLTLNKIMAGFGGKYMVVFSDSDPALRMPQGKNFDLGDAQAISKITGVTMIALQKLNRLVPVSYQNRYMQINIHGTDPNFLVIRNRKIAKGRFIDMQDILNERRVCVITESVKKRFFPAGDYLKQSLTINGTIFEIIGCLEPMLIPAALGGNSEEGAIYTPLTTSQKLFNQYDFDTIFLRYGKDYEKKQKMALLQGRLKSILEFRKGTNANYILRTMDENTAAHKRLVLIVSVVLCSFAILCLLVGGIGVTNMMMVTVMERAREIGMGKAFGTKNHEILYQFLVESTAIATLGGISGLMLGIFSSRLVAIFTGMPLSLSWWVLFSEIGFIFLVGIGFGFYPAQKAANVQPMNV